MERIDGLERQALLLKLGFLNQYGQAGAAGGRKLEEAQQDFLSLLGRGDKRPEVSVAEFVDLVKAMKAHRGTNRRVS